MIAPQPHFKPIFELPVVCDIPRRRMTVAVEKRFRLGELMVQPARGRVVKRKSSRMKNAGYVPMKASEDAGKEFLPLFNDARHVLWESVKMTAAWGNPQPGENRRHPPPPLPALVVVERGPWEVTGP
jgi:hypothetical protein